MDDPYSTRPWLAEYPGDQPAELIPRFPDMVTAFASAASEARDRPFLSYFGWRGTFGDVDRASSRLAERFRELGVSRGDRVAIVGQNTPMFAEAVIACWKLGAIPVPCNPMYRAAELTKIFANGEPTLCYCEEHVLQAVRTAIDEWSGGSAEVIAFSPWERGRGDTRVLPKAGTTVAQVSDTRNPRRFGGAVPDGSDLGLLLYTSGTTGLPKGVMLTHRSIAFNAQAMGEWGGVDSTSIVLGVAPLFHITGFISHLCMAIIKQAALVLTYRFEPNLVLETIKRERPTYTVAAITVFIALMNTLGVEREDFVSLTSVYSGGAAIPPSMIRTLRETIGIDLRPCYGMTETCSPTHSSPPGAEIPADGISGALSIGVPIYSTEARVVDEHGRPVPIGSPGELWMRGPQIMRGYWNDPVETVGSLTEGWMKSGDIGFMDARGFFYIVDRKKDMINASGFKVWPREVEDRLYEHPAVLEAAVIGVPDAYRGETVLAYVSIKADHTADERSLVDHCRLSLAAYKVPRSIRIIDELPKTATGKIQRNILRERTSA